MRRQRSLVSLALSRVYPAVARDDPDHNYQAYMQGLKEGRALIRANYLKSGDDDIIDLALEDWPLNKIEDFDIFLEDCTDEEYLAIAKNFIDGMEDGLKSALSRWLDKFKKERNL
jgi:hypothetical protein